MNQPYQYTPLSSPTSIRLARRLGKNVNGQDEISLTEIDLSSTNIPPFHCLSYTWGNPYASCIEDFEVFEAAFAPENSLFIGCEGKIMKIRKNLYDFLQQGPTHGYSKLRNMHDPVTGETVLHEAATEDSFQIQLAIRQGISIDVRDLQGQTPLHKAAAGGYLDNVIFLLRLGADINVRDYNGQTAANLATKNGHHEVVTTLRKYSWEGTSFIPSDLAEMVPRNPDTYVWIDAICIDQANLSERAAQVSIMETIYSRSTYVVVWLGPDDGHVDAAISAIHKLGNNAERYGKSQLIPFRLYTPEQYAEYQMPYISGEEWNGLEALYRRQWFRRIWVVQEAVYAQKLLVCCGTQILSWNDIEKAASALEAGFLNHSTSNTYIPWGPRVEKNFLTIRDIKDWAPLLKSELKDEPSASVNLRAINLRYLIMLLVSFESTDPRDKVYALLPLAKLISRRKNTIQPDYTISVAECYARFTKLWIADMKRLVALEFISDSAKRTVEGLPSWVPDFSLKGTKTTYFASLGFLDKDEKQKLSLEESLAWNELHLQGMQLDQVVGIAAPRRCGDPDDIWAFEPSWFELIRYLPRLTAKDGRQLSRGEVLWRTLCTDTDLSTSDIAPMTFGPMFKQFVCASWCSEMRQAMEKEFSDMNRNGTFVSRTQPVDEETLRIASEQTKLHEHNIDVEARSGQLPGLTNSKIVELSEPQKRQGLRMINAPWESRYVANAKHGLDLFESLKNENEEQYIPTRLECLQYMGVAPDHVSTSTGRLYTPREIYPFVKSYSLAYRQDRRLFVTHHGRLGLGPNTVEVGDTIWLLPGLDLPAVLRPHKVDKNSARNSDNDRSGFRTFEFVGATYLHGAMRKDFKHHFQVDKLEKIVLV